MRRNKVSPPTGRSEDLQEGRRAHCEKEVCPLPPGREKRKKIETEHKKKNWEKPKRVFG